MGRRYAPQPHLDQLTMSHLGSVLRPEYDPLIKSSVPRKQCDLLFQYALAEAAPEAGRCSHEARRRLRERSSIFQHVL